MIFKRKNDTSSFPRTSLLLLCMWLTEFKALYNNKNFGSLQQISALGSKDLMSLTNVKNTLTSNLKIHIWLVNNSSNSKASQTNTKIPDL